MKREGRVVEGMAPTTSSARAAVPTAPRRQRGRSAVSPRRSRAGAEDDAFFRIVAARERRAVAPARALRAARWRSATLTGFRRRGDGALRPLRARGDHASFTKRGFPGIRFTEKCEDYRHQHEDVRKRRRRPVRRPAEFVDFDTS
jgi:hypothetical protein